MATTTGMELVSTVAVVHSNVESLLVRLLTGPKNPPSVPKPAKKRRSRSLPGWSRKLFFVEKDLNWFEKEKA